MLKPVTETARNFNEHCLALADFLKEIDSGDNSLNKRDKISQS